MASILKVDTIQTAAGGTPTAADLGLNTTGSVLQTVQGSDTTSADTFNSSSAWTASSMTASITPTNSTSKILVVSHANVSSTGSQYLSWIGRIERSINGGSYTAAYDNSLVDGGGNVYGGYWFSDYAGSTELFIPAVTSFLDEPSTTSQVTYRLSCRKLGGYGDCHVRPASHFVLMEIAG